eukprot:12420571-Karenia_brevis.AAC.1
MGPWGPGCAPCRILHWFAVRAHEGLEAQVVAVQQIALLRLLTHLYHPRVEWACGTGRANLLTNLIPLTTHNFLQADMQLGAMSRLA